MLHIRVVDSNHQGFSSFGRSDRLSVRRVKSLGLQFTAYCECVTANRHMASTHIAEAANLEHPGRCPIWHPSAKLGEQITHLGRCPPRNDLPKREVVAKFVKIASAITGPVSSTSKSERAKYRLNAFGANILDALRAAAVYARPATQGVSVSLASNYLDLDSAQQLLALLEGQPDLLRRQVSDRASNRANLIADRGIAVWRQLNPDRPFHRGGPPMPRGDYVTPAPPLTFHSHQLLKLWP
jgi:hypothetical protein